MKKILIIIMLLGTSANACSFDTDCSPGSSCLKNPNSLYGVCSGGNNPGNTYDQQPVKDYYGSSVGNTCSFDTDCSVGQSCHKGAYSLNGVCR